MRASVIIPTCGSPESVKVAIRAVLAADALKANAEVIVVDNNDDNGISGILRDSCTSAGEPVRYVAEPSPGATAARHRGAKEAVGDILIFIDDDVEVSSGWLGAVLRAFEDCTVGIVGGPSIPVFPGSIPAWFWEFLVPTPYGGWCCTWLSLLDIGHTVDQVDPLWIWTLNFGVRRDVLRQLGGFHPDLVPSTMQRWQGDGETGLAYKAKAAGVRSAYLCTALVHHRIRSDRLTSEYFANRAYFQGICDSFTQIRGGVPPSLSDRGPRPIPQRPNEGMGSAQAAYEIKLRTDQAYNDGWVFHQREVASDPNLLNWVRREDFWEGDILEETRRPGIMPRLRD